MRKAEAERKREEERKLEAQRKLEEEQRLEAERKAEIRRRREEKRNSDPNRFIIPKVDKSEKRMDIKTILEEGLKKANATVSSGSSISSSFRAPTGHSYITGGYNKKGRYEDRRKEMKLIELRKKEKKIDIKKVKDILKGIVHSGYRGTNLDFL
jgi:hypothetical protein